MNAQKRFVSVVLICGILFAVLCLPAVTSTASGHDCPGEHCLICCVTEQCKDIGRLIVSCLLTALLLAVPFCVCHIQKIPASRVTLSDSLVMRKVKLSD